MSTKYGNFLIKPSSTSSRLFFHNKHSRFKSAEERHVDTAAGLTLESGVLCCPIWDLATVWGHLTAGVPVSICWPQVSL